MFFSELNLIIVRQLLKQDQQLNALRTELSELTSQVDLSDRTVDELRQQLQQTKDQNALLKASKGELP